MQTKIYKKYCHSLSYKLERQILRKEKKLHTEGKFITYEKPDIQVLQSVEEAPSSMSYLR